MAEETSKVYFIATDPENRTVTCSRDSWKHVKKQHPEVERPSQLKNAIQKPYHILTNKRKALIYTIKTDSNLFFNVIVETKDDYPYPEGGEIKTAHFTRELLNGSIIWSR